MSTLNSDVYGEAIRQTIMQRAGTSPDACAVADAALAAWQDTAAQIEPVIGARGVDALFGRSLHLVGKTYQWLEGNGIRGNGSGSLATLRTCFEGQESTVAIDAACALLSTFTGLLANLIGEALTRRLLNTAWLVPVPETGKDPRP